MMPPQVLTCMKQHGVTMAFIACEAYGAGGFPLSCPRQIVKAWKAGMSNVDITFLDTSFGNTTELINFLSNHSISSGSEPPYTYGRVWINQLAISTFGRNRYWFGNLTKTLEDHQQSIGVRTNNASWTSMLGHWDGGSSYPLWNEYPDGVPSFANFTTFGGWKQPAMKEYINSANSFNSLCNGSVTLVWGYQPDPDM
eukprot:gb/GECG01000549.1/.p1 GENE.gb/GECG01000549.1/~~gb/GECG01000549.1/.p1  ORF type:complete len:197 (+),score=9.53 gb/GECG01000549.1/:1-591(+)